jgi:hypothetical protein
MLACGTQQPLEVAPQATLRNLGPTMVYLITSGKMEEIVALPDHQPVSANP